MTIGYQSTNASSVDALGGPFGTFGLSGSAGLIPIAAGVDVLVGKENDKTIVGEQYGGGLGLKMSPFPPSPVEIHSGGTGSWVLPFPSVYDVPGSLGLGLGGRGGARSFGSSGK